MSQSYLDQLGLSQSQPAKLQLLNIIHSFFHSEN